MLSILYLICAIITLILSRNPDGNINRSLVSTMLAGISIGGSFTILFHSMTGTI